MLYAFGAILSCSLLASLKPSFSLTSLLIDQLCRLAHSRFGADAPGKDWVVRSERRSDRDLNRPAIILQSRR
jgi:hypothetical protein